MSGPVFVDPSGRRLGALRLAGRAAGGVFAGYLLLVVVSLVAPPGLDRLEVPGVGGVLPAQRAPQVVTSDGDETGASAAVDRATRSGAPPVSGPARTEGATGGSTPGGTPVPSTPQGGPTPTAGPAKGRPTTPPGQATTSPGRSAQPTARSTPKGKATPKGKTTPGPTPTARSGSGRANAQPSVAPGTVQ